MTDIVERLRKTSAGGLDEYGVHCEIEAEAADEIEWLRAVLQEIADMRYDNTSAATIAQTAIAAPGTATERKTPDRTTVSR
jgi:hypothetical protein